ncbi:MAG: hypothetical protein JNL62_27365 [Bryobacterales bacterium]|nr:hypothetical protein [Bryobacterales bacterium]
MIALTGQSAPELQFSEHIGAPPVPLASLKGKPVADPLTLYDCSLISDGAAAVLICPLERAAEFGPEGVAHDV